MRVRRAIPVLVLLAAVAPGPAGLAGEPPTSERSVEAVARVRPKLEAALAERGLRFGAPVFHGDELATLWGVPDFIVERLLTEED